MIKFWSTVIEYAKGLFGKLREKLYSKFHSKRYVNFALITLFAMFLFPVVTHMLVLQNHISGDAKPFFGIFSILSMSLFS